MAVTVYRHIGASKDENGSLHVRAFTETFPSLDDAKNAPVPDGVRLSYIPTERVLLGLAIGETDWTERRSSRAPLAPF